MNNKSAVILLVLLITAFTVNAQLTYLPLGQEEYHLLDRIETRSGYLSDSIFLTAKPVSRRAEVDFLQKQRQDARIMELTKVDLYNMFHAISVSGEWAANGDGAIDSKHPILNFFHLKQPDFAHIYKPGFFLSINPVLGAQFMYEQNDIKSQPLITHTEGLAIRSRIADKVGLYLNLTNNYEQQLSYVNARTQATNAVQGAGYYNKESPNTYQYIQGEGAIDVALIKNHVNATAGYGKHFIGDGIRTLFLSDYAAPAPYLRLTTRIWKINYQNLYLELKPQTNSLGTLRGHKYATMHHLSVNVTRWLNLGLFEAVVFDRGNHFEFGYMNPLILYRQTERAFGSPDKVNLGLNFKAIAAQHLQFYGQFLLNEFTASQFFSQNGYWANKWGLQLGGKYFDAFTIKNLDLQAELNMVRPYTFTHYDNTANFTHYNQPLAHPLGAGFREVIGSVRYQPTNNLFINFRATYYEQGADTGASNFGSNIFLDYDTRSQDYGVHMINGVKTTCAIVSLDLSYRIRENYFADLGFTSRQFTFDSNITSPTMYFYGGLRINLARRDYNQY